MSREVWPRVPENGQLRNFRVETGKVLTGYWTRGWEALWVDLNGEG